METSTVYLAVLAWDGLQASTEPAISLQTTGAGCSGPYPDLLWQSFPARLLSSSSTTPFWLHSSSSDLSFNRHVFVVSVSSFYWLRQLQRYRRSLDVESAATLVHSSVASRFDYCNTVLAGAPKATTNKLQRVWSAPQRYPQVRPRLVATPPYRAILAGCSWASHVQARRHGVQLPARSSASVPRGIVPTGPRCRGNSFRQSLNWRRFCLQRTDAFSALEVSRRCAI